MSPGFPGKGLALLVLAEGVRTMTKVSGGKGAAHDEHFDRPARYPYLTRLKVFDRDGLPRSLWMDGYRSVGPIRLHRPSMPAPGASVRGRSLQETVFRLSPAASGVGRGNMVAFLENASGRNERCGAFADGIRSSGKIQPG
jgi:hypothetical protein